MYSTAGDDAFQGEIRRGSRVFAFPLALTDMGLSDAAVRVMLSLLIRGDGTPVVTASDDRVAASAGGMEPGKLSRALRELEAKALIRVEPGSGGAGPRRIVISEELVAPQESRGEAAGIEN